MIKEYEGEAWCIAKHLLAASMRLIEVGTKLLSDNKRDEAKDIFQKAYRVYATFWAVRLKITDLPKVKDAKKPWTVEDIVNKLVDCCDE